MERCIPIVIDDGTAEDSDQAVAACSSMWEEAREGEQGGKMIRKTVPITIEKKDENGGRIIISTGDLDRDKDRVLPHGAQIADYLRNPVVQYGHNYSDPWATVGRTTSLSVNDKGVTADFELRPAANEQDPQNIVRLLWEGEWIRTASIGFVPLGFEENSDGGLDYTNWQLLEWSLVPVPANQNALRMAVKALGCDENPHLPNDYKANLVEMTRSVMGQGQGDSVQELDNMWEDMDVSEITAHIMADKYPLANQFIQAIEKRGRVLSAANENKLRKASDLLREVLAQVEEVVDDEKTPDFRLPPGVTGTVTYNNLGSAATDNIAAWLSFQKPPEPKSAQIEDKSDVQQTQSGTEHDTDDTADPSPAEHNEPDDEANVLAMMHAWLDVIEQTMR
jgi:hypothetical protein